MEGPKFQTPYNSISVGRDSWSKEICEIRSLLHELIGNPTRSKPTPVEFTRFCGENPELWMSKAESYFDFYEIAENHKLSLASSYLDGAALSWYQWLLLNKQLVDWEHFIAKVLVRFPKLHLESLENHLANQMSSMTGYTSRFEAISWGFTKTNVLFSCPTHVYTQWRSKNNPVLPQKFDMQSKCKSKMDAHNMFDEMSTRVFTKEVEETFSAAILLGDLDDIQSTRVLDESVHSCFHKLVVEVQPDTPIKMLDEEELCLEHNKVQLFNECSPRNMSKSIDVHGASINLCVWDLSISFKLKALTDYTLNTKLLILLGSTSTFGFIANANFMTQVWIPDNKHMSWEMKLQKLFVLHGFKVVSVHDGLVGMALRNFSTLAELKGLVGAQGDKIIVCPPTLSLYEVVALQTCQNDHGSLYVIESELELVKVASIVVAYVVHKAILSITDAHDSPNIEKVMKIVGLSKAEQVTIFKILASVMMLSNMDLAKGNEIVSSIVYVDNTWFHLCTTIAALYTHSSLERFNIILSVWLHSNLEGKVLIGEGSIVMNGPKSVMVK
ncbi:hypothetical protein T459_17789 [Capsicum annuum]|uniref:Retrotransposon gag domain-containing protein n=1 Tax=Capsicum annuum TaxID=4072 RepID=A0A2G2ZCJ1_CAPAN|nr:hypothetical protein T459_17789 [Capsicum annuum]